MLLRASEGVILGRPKKVLRLSSEDESEYVESRRSAGLKKRASPLDEDKVGSAAENAVGDRVHRILTRRGRITYQ
ncbi:hypothetical protein KCU65_g421, partial [Aureobasidium melanogenum]